MILEILWLVCYNPEIDKKTKEVKMMRYLDKCEKQWKIILWLQDLRVNQVKEFCIRINIRELDRELCTELSTLYI